MLSVWFVHFFLKLSKIDISKLFHLACELYNDSIKAIETGLSARSYIRGCDLGAALGAIKLGKGEHLLRSGSTAGDSFVGFDGIFERYRVYSRHL